jgi:preprotein translocase subunit SecE
MAKITPGQFVRQVRQEMSKVTWPGRREAGLSMVMVFAFCSFIGVFFMIVDKILSLGVSWLFG